MGAIELANLLTRTSGVTRFFFTLIMASKIRLRSVLMRTQLLIILAEKL